MEPPDTDHPPLTRTEWVALILIALGMGLTIVFLGFQLWPGAGVSAALGWSGIHLLTKHMEHSKAPPPVVKAETAPLHVHVQSEKVI